MFALIQAVWLCGAMYAVIFALVREEQATAPGFSLWHEAIALGTLVLLIYGLKRLIAYVARSASSPRRTSNAWKELLRGCVEFGKVEAEPSCKGVIKILASAVDT